MVEHGTHCLCCSNANRLLISFCGPTEFFKMADLIITMTYRDQELFTEKKTGAMRAIPVGGTLLRPSFVIAVSIQVRSINVV